VTVTARSPRLPRVKPRGFNKAYVHLTPREEDVLALIGQGRTNPEMGNGLALSLTRVKNGVSEVVFANTGPVFTVGAGRKQPRPLPREHPLPGLTASSISGIIPLD
jgi:hypothetical protein